MSIDISGDVVTFDGGRIVLTRHPNGYSIAYNDPNPMTRWMPLCLTWRERVRLAWWDRRNFTRRYRA